MIQIRSHYGAWQTVDREHAERFIRNRIDSGARHSSIDGNSLRGITVLELLGKRPPKQRVIEPPARTIQMASKPKSKKELVLDSTTAAAAETLARKQAFLEFMRHIQYSLIVWQIDETVRENCEPVTDWVKDCANALNDMLVGLLKGLEGSDAYRELQERVGKKEVDDEVDGGIIDVSDGDAVKIQQVRDEILSDRTIKGLNETHQNWHIKDSGEYKEGRSIFDGTPEEAQELINAHHGTGEIRLDRRGNWIGKEFVTLDRDIGTHIDIDGNETTTNTFAIHYSKRGAHIVPARRKLK